MHDLLMFPVAFKASRNFARVLGERFERGGGPFTRFAMSLLNLTFRAQIPCWAWLREQHGQSSLLLRAVYGVLLTFPGRPARSHRTRRPSLRLACSLPGAFQEDANMRNTSELLLTFDFLRRLSRPLRRQDQDTLRTQGRATLTHQEVYEELDSELGECLLGPVGHWIYHHEWIIKHQRVASNRNHARRSASSIQTSIIAVEA